VARKKDAEQDPPSKAILDQLQTKTVGPPPSTTGLSGDQLPETIFKVADFDQVKNQVTLQLSNLELLNVLNTVGQVTNTQSQSGPIANTHKIATTGAITSSTSTIIFRPDPGQVWVCTGVQMDASGGTGAVTAVLMYADGTNEVRIESNSTAGTAEFNITSTAGPLFVSNDVYLQVVTSSVAAGEQAIFNASVVRVR